MRVVPPDTDLTKFSLAKGEELQSPLFAEPSRFLQQPNKPMILALSRPDRRKNITALIDAYGQSPELQEMANLIIVAGNRDDIDDLNEGAQEVFKALLWSTLATRDTTLLHHSLHKRFEIPSGYAWVNYVRCHDNIGWVFSDDVSELGVDPQAHRRFITNFYIVKFEGSFACGQPFQENPAMRLLLSRSPIAVFVCVDVMKFN